MVLKYCLSFKIEQKENVMRKRRMWTVMAVMFVIALLIVPMRAMASHPDVALKNAAGNTVTANEPYSPKQSCGGCHFKCSDGTYSTDQTTWCDGTAGKLQKDCTVAGNCPDYASAATADTSHIQGYANSSKLVTFQTYTIKSPAHGASVGLHSQQGRNEEVTAAQRTIWGAPAFISSPGMYGRY
jgi:hypothetical protein